MIWIAPAGELFAEKPYRKCLIENVRPWTLAGVAMRKGLRGFLMACRWLVLPRSELRGWQGWVADALMVLCLVLLALWGWR